MVVEFISRNQNMVGVIFLLLPSVAIFIGFLWLRINEEKSSKVLSGNKGLPILGETLSFIKPHSTSTIGDFMQDHISRYGKIFSSNLLGSLAIISADAEMNRFVYQNDLKLFKSAWFPGFKGIFGHDSLLFAVGDTHKRFRTPIVDFLSMKRLQTVFLEDANLTASALVKSWKDGHIISAKEVSVKYSIQIMAKNVLSMTSNDPRMEVLREYDHFMPALVSIFPMSLPGTKYWKALKGRRNIIKVIKEIMEGRIVKYKDAKGDEKLHDSFHKNEGRDEDYDFLDCIMKRTMYTNEAIENSILGLLFAGHDTTSRAIAFMIYLLADCPEVVKRLQEEHLQIAKSKLDSEHKVSWDDYKNMKFTECVINETLRLCNAAPFIPKKATKDIQYKDIIIPRGCIVMVHMKAVHLSSTFYDNPMHFNPWRWLGPSNVKRSKSFMPFGGGARMCPGANLVKLEMTIFLHHFMLNYEWEKVQEVHPMSIPYVEYPNGLPIRIHAAQYK